MNSKQLNLYKTKTGNYWLPNPNADRVLIDIVNDRVFDEEIVKVAIENLKFGDNVLDIGSNFGQMAVLFSRAVGAGKVISFEADPWIFSVLQKNIAENNCRNVLSYHYAVWDKTGETLIYPEADFTVFDSWGSFGINPKASEGQKVKSIKIDDLPLPRPIKLIKIDIQGADLNALKGAKNTILQDKPVILFEYEHLFDGMFDTTWKDYEDFFKEINYTMEMISFNNYKAVSK